MEKKTLGNFIAALRRANGLTQRELADKLNVSDKAVSRWERDETLPDLSLIPELADVFGVTADEILRGERKNPESTVTSPASDKGEKQRRRLLADKKSKYRIRSTVSIGISLVGLIAAMICNFGFLRAYIGFLIGAVFFLASVVCQIGFIFNNLSGVDEEMLTEEDTVARNEHTFKLASGSFTVTAVLLCACLPLLVFPYDTYQGLNADSWILYGLLFAGLAFTVCLIAFCAVGSALKKRGLILADSKSAALHALRVKFVRTGALILVGLFVGQLFVLSFLPGALKQGKRFDTWEDFKTFMETPTPSQDFINFEPGYADVQIDAVPVAPDDTIDSVYEIDEVLQYIYDEQGNVLCSYYHRNESISSWSYSTKDPENPQIVVYTTSEIRRVNHIMDDFVIPIYCMFYPAVVLILFLEYRKQKNAL